MKRRLRSVDRSAHSKGRILALLAGALLLLAPAWGGETEQQEVERDRQEIPEDTSRPAAEERDASPEPADEKAERDESEPATVIPYDGLEPLAAAIEELERVAERDGWTKVPEGPLLQEEDSGPRVTALRKRLAETGELSGEAASGETYDAEVTEAVEEFQRRHGIKVDGLVGPNTLREINVGADERVQQAKQALDRMREFAAEAESRYVLVNIPDFRLFWIDGGAVADEMKVIVGSEGWETPTMDETIEHLVTNPDWDVPASIVASEIASQVAEDPGYLEENHMEVLSSWEEDAEQVDPATIDWANVTESSWDYRLRQRPGPENPLGTVKFMFPNDEAIYLHGTPAQHLFERDVRAISHGCIRVERPREMAEHLLQGFPEQLRALDEGLATPSEQEWHELPRETPIHLLYWYAFVGEDGEVHFRPDPWDRPDGS